MIAYISGRLLEKLESSVVIDTGGIGYEVFIPANSRVFLKAKGDDVVLSTVQIVKEDDIRLYGFEDRATLGLFKLLITVSGVGAKAAMAILSAMHTDDAVKAIAFSDPMMLTRANGVGKKSAERIVLELKDKVNDIFSGELSSAKARTSGDTTNEDGNVIDDAIEVLMSLGYNRSEAAVAINNIHEEFKSVEEAVKLALKTM